MNEPNVTFNTLLAPVDLSENSHAAFEKAVRLVSGESPVVIALYVIDGALPELAESLDLGSREDVVKRMRDHANARMQEYADAAPPEVEVDLLVCEGTPFLEILQKADDFAVDAIVMGKVGRGDMENLLFGSTAEKVIRGSSRPVLVLPGLRR